MSNAAPAVRPQTPFDQLRTWILNGSLAPGQRLPVRDIALGLGVSTMPVREALVRLEVSGLVTQEHNKGAVVSRLSVADLIDYYDLRRIIEPPSLQQGIQRMTPERLVRLRSTYSALQQAVADGDLVSVLDLDEDMLLLVHEAVANPQLIRVIRSTWARVRSYKLLFTTIAQEDAGTYIAEINAELLATAEAGDAARARDWMATTLQHGQLRLADLLRVHDAQGTGAIAPTSAATGEPLAAVIARLVDDAAESTS